VVGGFFFSGILVSSTNKTDRNHIAKILLKVALNTINQTVPKTSALGVTPGSAKFCVDLHLT